jgi:microcystin-dependent protein
MTYTQVFDPMANAVSETMIQRDEDGAFVPFDSDNTDYQAYLAWLDEGNEPNPVPPNPVPPIEEAPAPDIFEVNAQVQDIEERLSALETDTARSPRSTTSPPIRTRRRKSSRRNSQKDSAIRRGRICRRLIPFVSACSSLGPRQAEYYRFNMATLTPNYGWTQPAVGGDATVWGNHLNDDLALIDAQVWSNEQATVVIGQGTLWFSSTPPANWLICNGQSLVTTGTYAALFAVIGYTYGGNGANFNLPNLQLRFPLGIGTGVVLGAIGGATTSAILPANMPAHAHAITDVAHNHVLAQTPHGHGVSDPGHAHTTVAHAHTGVARQTGTPNILAGEGAPTLQASSTDTANVAVNAAATGIDIQVNDASIGINASGTGLSTTQSIGGGVALPIMPPFVAVQFIIRYR